MLSDVQLYVVKHSAVETAPYLATSVHSEQILNILVVQKTCTESLM